MKKTYICTLQGTTAILMHRFGDAEEMGANTRKVHVKAQDPRETAEKGAYRNAAGELYVPGTAIARMIREGAAAHKQRGSRKSMKYVISSAVQIPVEEIVIRDSEGDAITHFEIDSRPVVIPSTKGRVMRHRARVNPPYWLEFPVVIDDEVVDPGLVHQIFGECGFTQGLLDYRPEKGGPFGVFAVVSWAALEQTAAVLAEAAD
jgi:hypothetical protein